MGYGASLISMMFRSGSSSLRRRAVRREITAVRGVPSRVLKPLDGELFELVFDDHLTCPPNIISEPRILACRHEPVDGVKETLSLHESPDLHS